MFQLCCFPQSVIVARPATPGAPSHPAAGSAHVLSSRACTARYFYAGSVFATAGFRDTLQPSETVPELHTR